MYLTLKQLHHARLLAATGNFTAAARRANLTQSAFSRSIEKLEHQLGVQLFDRRTDGVKPTVFGLALVDGARDIEGRIDAITQQIDDIRGLVTGSLSVALGVYPAEISVHKALGRMMEHYPGVSLRARICNWEDVNERVLSGSVDLAYAVIDQAAGDARLEVEPVISHELAYYVRSGHPLAGLSLVAPSQIDEYPLVSIRVPAALAPMVSGRAEVDANTGFLIPSIEIDDFSVARGVVRAGNAVGVTTPVQIEEQLADGDFVLLQHPRPWLAPVFGFIKPRGQSLSTAATAFQALVRRAEEQAECSNKALFDRYLPM
jgi:DNA-binding transcriptional LysR family regulator